MFTLRGTEKKKGPFFDFNGSQTGTEQMKALEAPRNKKHEAQENDSRASM